MLLRPSPALAPFVFAFALSVAASARAQVDEGPAPTAPPAEAPEPADPVDAADPAELAAAPQNLPPPPPPRAAAGGASAGPVIQVETPPPPPAQPRRGYHVHDGFYLRLNLGVGSGHAAVADDDPSRPDFSMDGGSLVLGAWVGGTPARGLALGGLLTVATLGADRVEVDDVDTFNEIGGSYALLGAFVDGHPDPTGGFHLGGSFGLARVRLDAKDNAQLDDVDAGGLGLSAWIGYDAWISSDWSIGGLIQLVGVLTREEKDERERQPSAGGVSLSFTALYH